MEKIIGIKNNDIASNYSLILILIYWVYYEKNVKSMDSH